MTGGMAGTAQGLRQFDTIDSMESRRQCCRLVEPAQRLRVGLAVVVCKASDSSTQSTVWKAESNTVDLVDLSWRLRAFTHKPLNRKRNSFKLAYGDKLDYTDRIRGFTV